MYNSLSGDEAMCVADAFLSTLYTHEVYLRWTEMKRQMSFTSEREFVVWMMDCVEGMQYHDEGEDMVAVNQQEAQLSSTLNMKQPQQQVDHQFDVDHIEPAVALAGVVNKIKPETVVLIDSPPTLSAAEDVGDEMPLDGQPHTVMQQQNDTQVQEEWLYDTSPPDDAASENYLSDDTCHYDERNVAASSKGRRKRSTTANVGEPSETRGAPFTCPYAECGKLFSYQRSLRFHMRTQHEVTPAERHACPHCTHTCLTRQNLQSHLVRRHGFTSSYQCEQCGKYLVDQRALRSHVTACGRRLAQHGLGDGQQDM